MKVLSLDPGYDRCGIALLETGTDAKTTLITSHTITTDKQLDFADRLLFVVEEMRRWIHEHKPDACALETLYVTRNQKTAMRVAEVRGALLLTARESQVPIYEYGPGEVKVAVTGDGRATKDQVMFMVPRLIEVNHPVKYDDEYDAIAVGLTACAVLGGPLSNV